MKTNHLEKIDLKALGENLKRERQRVGLTQAEAGEIIGVKNRTTIVAIEKGERKIKPLELVKLAKAYGKLVNYFLKSSAEIEPFWPKFQKELRRIQALNKNKIKENK